MIETSYMIDLASLEVGFYSSLLSQFTFICFFSQFLVGAGLVSYLINLLIIYLTIRIYTRVSRRPISRKVSSIGIWNKLFDIVSYIGIVYNTIVTVRYTTNLEAFVDLIDKEQSEIETAIFQTELIYRVQFALLIFKFLYSIIVPALPDWIKTRVSRENLVKNRNSKDLSTALSRFKKVFNKKYEEMFEDQDSADLKDFFKNEADIKEFVLPKEKDGGDRSDNSERVVPLFRIENAKKKLL